MADLAVSLGGIHSPNPFWLASSPATSDGDRLRRAFDAGWGGAVGETVRSTRRGGAPLSGLSVGGRLSGLGFSPREGKPDPALLREIAAVRAARPSHALVVSLPPAAPDLPELVRRAEDTGCDGLELPVGQLPVSAEGVAAETARLRSLTKLPILVKIGPLNGETVEAGSAAVRAGADGLVALYGAPAIAGLDLASGVRSDGERPTFLAGPALKPLALHAVSALARDPGTRVPLAGVGGISSWQDAAEFLALGASVVQVGTAVLTHGLRIIDDLVEGLADFLDERDLPSVASLPRIVPVPRASLFPPPVARIDEATCIGCDLCYVACADGATRCIHRPWEIPAQGHVAPRASERRAAWQADPRQRVPWIDETECIGCNLCALVCPVKGCITLA